MNNLQKTLQALYLEWVNDHLTLSHISEHYGIDTVDMDQLIHIGRKIHETEVQRLKDNKINKLLNKTFKTVFDLMGEIRKIYPFASYSVVSAFGIGYRIYPDKEGFEKCLGETNDTDNGRYKFVPPTY